MERVVRKGQQLAILSKERGGISVCQGCWISRLVLSPLGLESIHLRGQLANVSSRCLVIEAAFSPLVGQLKRNMVGRSTDPAGRLAKGVARKDGRKLLIGV